MKRYFMSVFTIVTLAVVVIACTRQVPADVPLSRQRVPVQASTNRLGIHLLLDDGRNHWPTDVWPVHIAAAADLVGDDGVAVQLVRSDDLDPDKWQYFLDLCAQNRLRPIIRLATTFDIDHGYWNAPTSDSSGGYERVSASYADFLAELDWHSQPMIIVGNEPNHGNEWSGVPDPAAYASFLRAVSTAVHAQLPNAVVINAGLDPYTPHTNGLPFIDGHAYLDSESFIDGMLAADPAIFSMIDAWGSHPYPLGPFTQPPQVQDFQIDLLNGAQNANHQPPPSGTYNRGVHGYRWELWKLSANGIDVGDLPVMITEFGWRHADSSLPDSVDSGPGDLPAAAEMQQYVNDALYGAELGVMHDERVRGVVFFALSGDPAEWGHTNWLPVDSNGEIIGPPYVRLP